MDDTDLKKLVGSCFTNGTVSSTVMVKPEVGSSADSWGYKSNNNFELLDNVFASDGTSISLNIGAGKVLTLAGSTHELTTISATAATGTINFDFLTQPIHYYTSNAAATWKLNVRVDGSNALNSIMSNNDMMALTFMVKQGTTAYYQSAFKIDGNSVTPKWSGGVTPSAGNASGVDVYTHSILKTGSAAFTVFSSHVQYA